jgi:purine-nucleoside phosphorylase
MNKHLLDKVREASAFIQSRYDLKPLFGIILGTGLGSLVSEMEAEYEIPYQEIPHFPLSTVESHSGKLLFGALAGKPVVVMQGRFHFYEGYSMQQVTFPVRVMKYLGIEKLFISNASGGLNPQMNVSDLMILSDHINLLPESPLRGRHHEEFGPMFPDMSEPYDRKLINLAKEIARKNNIRVHVGVYAAVQGPNLETPAEYKYLSLIGADAVGMSTIPENIVARQMGIPCFAISVITDLGVEGKIQEVSVEKIIKAASLAEPKMTLIFKELISQI